VPQRPRDTVGRAKPVAPMTWAQRLKRVFAIDIETCPDCGRTLRGIFVARASCLISAFGCGFNRSMQHLVSKRREEEVADEEIPTEDSLH
jgi:hypothetical protein